MAEIIWAPKALDDLAALVIYIARDAPIAARRFAQKVVRRVEALKDQPLMGGVIPEDQTDTYREIIQGNHRVIYRVAGDNLMIVAVHHSARLLDTSDLE